ncbi:MAG: hypothetical protein US57_C0004G0006 [Candidatus Moranbacteria bacterium GW2011_GWC2_37_73]|nr:MAG: hypothetical protein UR95_C0002G0093 [Parcubacteria group bacterium GW2011_GWC1_36_108]KKQ01064.1 MAG: hypothetical protein US09_C0003G0064 [Candidatus Moranbacteria bacterium GW2011_GWD1_36_198]KKQ02466.1 MAG: hypothetical protein US10_C0001G0064 [Candidatus Moranbacteria bacterium GW2011_GWD2_36_198]KKQ40123.1 MAG: hypothetical protein US57_C0004G0006 [Candidatus Moranbacteria bacterium GW2011_GWC2_37_73]HAS00256.1 hypothetical protein [Candidatus Moranbacteria bacterium]
MNIKNVLQVSLFFLVVGAALFCVSSKQALAATSTTMSQSILPVRFVYLEKNGAIDSIWSNVTEKDSAYVVKFFDKEKNEVSMQQRMILKYVEKSKETTVSRQSTQEIKFVETKNGIEEIKTVV